MCSVPGLGEKALGLSTYGICLRNGAAACAYLPILSFKDDPINLSFVFSAPRKGCSGPLVLLITYFLSSKQAVRGENNKKPEQ